MITGGVTIPTEEPGNSEVGLGLGFAYRHVAGQGRELIMNGDDYGWSLRVRYDENTKTAAVVITNGSKVGTSPNQTTEAVEAVLKSTA
jgi:hypothetical protein